MVNRRTSVLTSSNAPLWRFAVSALWTQRRRPVVTAEHVFTFLSFFFLFHLPTEFTFLLLLCGNRRHRLENSTQCAEWSHFAFQHVVNLTYGHKMRDIQNSSPIHHLCETSGRLATNAVTASPHLLDKRLRKHTRLTAARQPAARLAWQPSHLPRSLQWNFSSAYTTQTTVSFFSQNLVY